ncbi:MAG: superoxide dismutase [Terriglobia bacterium]
MKVADLTRRGFLGHLALGAALTSFITRGTSASQNPPVPSGPFSLPPLPYAFDALEPYVDAKTMETHHDKHHQAYINNLNKAVAAHPELGKQPVETLVKNLSTLPEDIRTAVRNNGGGHANHSLFWQTLKKNNGARPAGDLGKAIDAKFGSYSAFQDQFTKAALGVFGSGWAWLSVDPNQQLLIESTPNQDSPLTAGHQPVFGIDVWEHAYYLKYQNKRADYVTAFYNVIDWDAVSGRYGKIL